MVLSMKNETINHSGYINLKSDKHIAYDLKNGDLSIHVAEDISELDGKQEVFTTSFDREQYLFCLQIPFRVNDLQIYPWNYKQYIDCAIRNYQIESQYTKAVFRFDELQFFCHSVEDDSIPTNKQAPVSTEPIKEFKITIDGKECLVKFQIRLTGIRHSSYKMNYISEVEISFDETNDIAFLHKLYLTVYDSFVFICNRQNITCTSMMLLGTYPTKRLKDGTAVDVISQCNSEMFFFNKYREEPEDNVVISHTSNVRGFIKHIDKLFKIIADDLSRTEEDGDATISIVSIHPSVNRKNLIDLQQSLHITSAFEFYFRRYLPPMLKEKEHHKKLKAILQTFMETATGKEKKTAKSLLKHIGNASLSDKIIAAYKGYDGWAALSSCISENWFQPNSIDSLAEIASEWRNELAHDKREYQPSVDTVKAVRLIEHLNYAIVLRQLGYEDWEIQSLLEMTLVR